MVVEVRRRLIDAVTHVVALRLQALRILLAPSVKNVPEVFAHLTEDGPLTLLPLPGFVIRGGIRHLDNLAEVSNVHGGIDF